MLDKRPGARNAGTAQPSVGKGELLSTPHSTADPILLWASFSRDVPDNLAGLIHEVDGRGTSGRDR